ncbi:hypothetical protein CDQ84_14595 [Clostridium thermosuccinogenes]|uniref:Atrophied bacterial Ig domain-containing protein n=1 Tax=Clostridium thermosuccinogenes TaxID=84032 RepID=A0A2K2FD72_9CLOT|nr:immunoglobulin-like domain-containing protein [Pseudoclostridium thermosuccinogenes]AUS97123.1 hypothetical protein CDO33_12145 [Pseudoclostridium thermosuccinogenes]PNT95553.1 hypothetical protein CDQ85_14460 [Pseudoclostridium thermosuccinogenes]PNT96714.1 hypothetical protein CDQ84_14595 [Pseudoclostridium thermosuccinogenes]
MDDTGKVTRPAYIEGDKVVLLTATIRKDSTTVEKTFIITVKKLEQSAQEKVDADAAWLTDVLILNGNSSLNNIISHLSLPIVGENRSKITWASSDTNIIAVDGTVTRLSYI